MNIQKPDAKETFLGLILASVTVFGWSSMPDQIAIHFNSAGQPDSIVGKNLGLTILPAMTAGLYLLFSYIPEIDPLGENIQKFQDTYQRLSVVLIGFMAYLQGLLVFWNLGANFTFNQALVPAIAGLYYFMGQLIEKAEQNWFVGIRTPWTMSKEEVWDRTHERCGPLFKIAAVITLTALLLPDYFILLTVAPVLIVSIYAALYSYSEYRKLN